MAKAISITIGERHFPRKEDLKLYMRAMIGKYALGDYLTPEDSQFCLTLFESHQDYPTKLKPGVVRIQVLEQEERTVGLQIHKSDNTSDNISWTDCVKNRK